MSQGASQADLFRWLKFATLNLWTASMGGNSGYLRRLHEALHSVEVGHLVMEYTTQASGHWTRPGTLGYLTKIQREPLYTEEEWDAELNGPKIPEDTFWYILSIEDGQEYRWHNCQFIRVLTGKFDYVDSSLHLNSINISHG